jgi:GTP pyrophosphokinase
MQRKNITFEQLSDIMAFRIVVADLSTCYQALGVVHSHFRVVPGRFKDYISTPKANNYQSLHTGLIGPLNQRIEVQIRTDEMHTIADYGIAAHWQYKRTERSHDGRQYAWLRSLLEILEHASGPEEFLEHTKLEMFNDQVFCFTPKGELIPLPKGATPVDFAYAIHSEIGDRTVGAKINGKQIPLRTILNNGDQVEIITSKTQSPSPTWERFVVTGKARARIRRFVRSQQREQFAELGRSMLHKNCIKEGLPFCDKAFLKICSKFNHQFVEDLYAAVGEGLNHPREILCVAFPEHFNRLAPETDENEETLKPTKSKSIKKGKTKKEHSLSIQGLIPGMALHLAGCCHPLPGDKIVGVVVTGKGITIHTQDCESLHMIDTERLMDLSWNDELDELERHIGRLKVTFLNRPGSLANMTAAISKHNGNIVNLKITHRSAEFWDLMVDIEVRDVIHLDNIMGALRSVSIITSVQRI